MLAMPALRAALVNSPAPVIAVTPIIGGKALKGPAAKLMAELGLEVGNETVARRYAGLAQVFVADSSDPLPGVVPGVRMAQAQTIMHTDDDRRMLAEAVLALADAAR
jgi:LPPG:FO 2-phospho-L-lactate transferase